MVIINKIKFMKRENSVEEKVKEKVVKRIGKKERKTTKIRKKVKVLIREEEMKDVLSLLCLILL